jgi:recombination protein RecA
MAKSKTKQTAASPADDRVKAREIVRAEIEKEYGKGSLIKLGDTDYRVDIPAIGTGIMGIDLALGVSIPQGRIIEIFGPESSGKTTLTLHIAAECQKRGGTVGFIDAEHALDTGYARDLGVNIKEMDISQPDSGEQGLAITEKLVRSGAYDLLIVDSVAALTPQKELDGEMGDSHMGLQARMMSQALRKITGAIAKTNCTVIFINQLRMKIGVMFGNPETTTGGRALPFYSSQRIDIRRIAQIKKDDVVIGSQTKIKVIKNKVAPPFREVIVDIMYGTGISRSGDLIEQAVKHGIIGKAGAWYSYGTDKIGQGKENTKIFLEENPELMDQIEQQIKTVINGGELPCDEE